MKKHFIIPIVTIMLTAIIWGIFTHMMNLKTNEDPFLKTAEILLNTYGFSVDADAEVIGFESDITEARSSAEVIRNSGAKRYNLEGVEFDLTALFSNDKLICHEYENSVVHVYFIPLVNSQGVETQAQFLFIDNTLAASYIVISNPLVSAYLNDAGITEPPTSFWPLDISKDVLNKDLDVWAVIFRQ